MRRRILLKCEHQQKTGSFKARDARAGLPPAC